MSFWVYENWTHEKAVVHKSECSYCQNGHGLHGTSGNGNDTSGNGNDKWHGPFVSKEAALNMAKKTGRKIKKFCGVCAP